MSTRVDILAAKSKVDEHVAQHHCKPAALLRADEQGQRCAERVVLWQQYMAVTARWGLDKDDAERVREQYAWQTALLGQRVQLAA